MPSEKHTIGITRYRTQSGKPTCALDWGTCEICQFLQTYKFGTCETCFFIPDDDRKKKTLKRDISSDGKIGEGFLIPFDGCPVWENRKNEK